MRSKVPGILYWILAILPLPVALILYLLTPGAYNLGGDITVSTSRWQMLIAPVANIVLGGLFYGLTNLLSSSFRKRMEAQILPPDADAFLGWFRVYIIAFLDVLCFCSIYGYYSLDFSGSATTVLMCRAAAAMLGVGGIAAGRILPRCTKRSILALRWSYTEKSDEAWYQVHKHGARLFFLAGAFSVLCAAAMVSIQALILSFLAFVLVLVFLYLYSRYIYFNSFRG